MALGRRNKQQTSKIEVVPQTAPETFVISKKRVSKAARRKPKVPSDASLKPTSAKRKTATKNSNATGVVEISAVTKGDVALDAQSVLSRKRKLKQEKGKKKKAKSNVHPVLADDAPRSNYTNSKGNANTFVPTDGPYEYEADPDDHCETDLRAYQHLKPLLLQIEKAKYGKNNGDLKIWDPYYCNGAVVANLARIGFPNTYNKNEDFYAVVASGKLPPHDVIMTSPPYSADHIERCMKHCAYSGKPWCVLLPNWVHRKDYYQKLLKEAPALVGCAPQYIGPIGNPYFYVFPNGSQRPGHIGADGQTTPFSSSWHVHLPGSIGGMRLLKNLEVEQKKNTEWVMARTVKGLRWCARKVEERLVSTRAREAARGARLQSAGAIAGVMGKKLGRGKGGQKRRRARVQQLMDENSE